MSVRYKGDGRLGPNLVKEISLWSEALTVEGSLRNYHPVIARQNRRDYVAVDTGVRKGNEVVGGN